MSEKIHPATPRRRQKAREQGRGPRSADLVSSALLLSTNGLLIFFGERIAWGLREYVRSSLADEVSLTLEADDAFRLILQAAISVGIIILPLLICILMCAVGIGLMQSGFNVVPSRIVPSLDRLSPAKSLGHRFSLGTLSRFAIRLIKLAALVSVSIAIARSSLPRLLSLVQMSIETMASTIFEMLTLCCGWIGLTLFAFALVDYALAWWQFERDLMMTEQELRDEMRETQRANAHQRGASTQAVTATAS